MAQIDGKSWVYNVVSLAGMQLIFRGHATVSDEKIRESINNVSGGLDAAGGIFGTLIVDIIALTFIWLAFMAAK